MSVDQCNIARLCDQFRLHYYYILLPLNSYIILRHFHRDIYCVENVANTKGCVHMN